MSYSVLYTKTDGTKRLAVFEDRDLALDALAAHADDPDCAYAMLCRPQQFDNLIARLEGEAATVATLLKCRPTEIAERVERMFGRQADQEDAIKNLRARVKVIEAKEEAEAKELEMVAKAIEAAHSVTMKDVREALKP